mgnify:CR=1 FL=1
MAPLEQLLPILVPMMTMLAVDTENEEGLAHKDKNEVVGRFDDVGSNVEVVIIWVDDEVEEASVLSGFDDEIEEVPVVVKVGFLEEILIAVSNCVGNIDVDSDVFRGKEYSVDDSDSVVV